MNLNTFVIEWLGSTSATDLRLSYRNGTKQKLLLSSAKVGVAKGSKVTTTGARMPQKQEMGSLKSQLRLASRSVH